MIEKPEISEDELLTLLREDYSLPTAQVVFLPLGADPNTVVYRVACEDGKAYFLKLRSGSFDETSVSLPKFLHDQYIEPFIAPLETRSGQLWGSLGNFKTILYPFVEGEDGYDIPMTPGQWSAFGKAVRRIHGAVLPPDLLSRIRVETYSPNWRDTVLKFLENSEPAFPADRAAMELSEILKEKRMEILDLVERAGRYARELRSRPSDFTLCHSDLHAGNLLISPGGEFYIVDWDDPILAPKERDLMFVGGGQGFRGYTPEEEEALFYRGYGPVHIDPIAITYYRYERIVQDIGIYCGQLLSSSEGGEDRDQSLAYLQSNFERNGTIDMAKRGDPKLRGSDPFHPAS
jgi:spectinomycin phosphotransferase